jgi:hypothetical protein
MVVFKVRDKIMEKRGEDASCMVQVRGGGKKGKGRKQCF